jgi:formate dehydrogenase major subunit
MAECHPVGFQWVVEGQERGAKVFHVDPRYTRTSAIADRYLALRAGTDNAFLGGVINYILSNNRYFHDYVVAYTNASHIVSEDFRLPDDLDGLFSGFKPEVGEYDTSTWHYAGYEGTLTAAAGKRSRAAFGAEKERDGEELEGASAELDIADLQRDETLQHPHCVFQLLRRHYARYTPEVVEQVCGTPKERFLELCQTLCDNSGRDRTSAFVYSVGWTQHTVGVQYIRAASIIQLLLGNIGRPGGGILALRGHASIQGSTDIPTLYDLLPGYLPMPHASTHPDLNAYVETITSRKGYWGNSRAFVVSLLKAWFGEHATEENHFCFDYLPRLTGDHSTYQTAIDMLEGKVAGFFLFGQNPAVGSSNSKLHRLAMAKLDWLVVRDVNMVESATFWKDGPEIETGELRTEDIPTEVFFMPSAAHTEKDGTFTNTQRLLQWHWQAVEPKDDCRSELWFCYHLLEAIRRKIAGSDDPKHLPLKHLTWTYPLHGKHLEPTAESVLAEIGGWDIHGEPLSSYEQLRADGSTRCGCWIYCGCYAEGVNQPARRKPGREQSWVAPEWGWAWPDNRRILYNRASADPDGKPWSERKRYVWWDARARRWTGEDTPDFSPDKPPDARPPDDARGPDALTGIDPFIMQPDGKGWLFAPAGLVDGPLPTSYEPEESPLDNMLYGQRANPARIRHEHIHNPYNNPAGRLSDGNNPFPYVATTYRVAEHHTAGGMSRFLTRLSELAPEMFVEVSPELAAERGLVHADWATVVTARSAIEARVLVTERMPSLTVQGRRVHQVGLPYHWGHEGVSKGDAANDLFHLSLDPNVHIQEVKAASCDIRPGRRPRGPALVELVDSYRRRAEHYAGRKQ